MKRRVADVIMDDLADLGIRQAFAVVGGGSMFLSHALGVSKRIKTIYCHHEQACAMAAEGYARYMCDRPALVSVTAGPGGTNALTGVAGAYVDSIPMVVVSGQCRYNTSVPESGLPLRTRGVQEFDIVNTVKTMTKYSKLVIDPLEIRREVRKAYMIAMNGRRGPVWLDIPQNVQNAQVEESDFLPCEPDPEIVDCTQEEVDNVMSLLKNAKRPCILAGGGIRYSGNYAAFIDFLSRVNVPVVTASAQPDVLYRQHKLHCGAEGMLGQRSGNFVLQNADVVLVLGASLTFGETGWVQENFVPTAHVISINVDEYEHRKPGIRVDTFVRCDLMRYFARTHGVSFAAEKSWLKYCSDVKEQFDLFEGWTKDGADRVNACNLWKCVDDHLPDEGIVCLGNSSCVAPWARCGNRLEKQRTLFNANFGSMGDDFPLAVGAAAASGKPVLLVTGDGSAMMNLQELQTIVYNHLPVHVIVLTNGGYNALRATWKRYFNGVNAGCDAQSGITMPEFDRVAQAFGFPYSKCRSNSEIDDGLSWLGNQAGFAMLEVCECIENRPAMPCVISRLRDDGTSEPAWLQDMSPYLDRETYKEQMISERV